MQIIPEEVSASVSSMAIEDTEETALRPVCNIFLCWRLHNVENNANSILIVVSDDALVGIGSISHDVPILTNTALSWFPHW